MQWPCSSSLGAARPARKNCRRHAVRRPETQATPNPGVRFGSHPGSVVSIFGAAPRRRGVLLKVVANLPYFDRRTRIFKLLFDFIRLFLVDPFLDRLWRRFDEVLGLLETEAGNRPHFLDNVYFLL